MRKRGYLGDKTLQQGYIDSLTSPISVKPGDARSLTQTQATTGVAAAGLGITAAQHQVLDDADAIHIERKSVEVARAKMRETMLDLLPSLSQTDVRRMVDINPSLRKRMVDRMNADPAGAKAEGGHRKDFGGMRNVRVNALWAREVVIEELTAMAGEDPQEFVHVMERAAGKKKQKIKAVDEVFQKSLVTFLENIPTEEEEAEDAEMVEGVRSVQATIEMMDTTTTMFSEPRATLLEWGTLSIRYALADETAKVNQVASVLMSKTALEVGKARKRGTIPASMRIWTDENGDLPSSALSDLALWAVLLGRSWAASGFPMLRPTHKLAAALMATGMPRELVPEVAMPWPTFAVLIPDGLLPVEASVTSEKMDDIEKKENLFSPSGLPASPLKFVGLTHGRYETGYTVWAAESSNTFLWSWNAATLADLMAPERMEGEEDAVYAVRELLGRLVIGTLIEMDSQEQKARIVRGPSGLSGKSGKSGAGVSSGQPAATWAFELRRDVKVDLRPWVKSYVSGGGKVASVRVLVRGHHKRQPYGPGRTLRKWITVEPFWRGDLNAPIALRAHRIGVVDPDSDE